MSEGEYAGPRSRPIEGNMWQVLRTLAEAPRDESGQAWMGGSQIREATNLSPDEINDAINLLVAQGLVEEYNQQANAIQVSLVFQILAAAYGEHLFNEIARDIISADIAVFGTSDQNPNVMIEMGVALTWG